MNNVLTKVMFICLGLVLVAGCRTGPLYNVSDSPITSVSKGKLTLEQITKAIIGASTSSRPAWNMKVVKPGHILASIHVRSHTAKVDITYTTESYNITYNNSSNLKYDPEENTIHSNYNGWIQQLDSAIRTNITML